MTSPAKIVLEPLPEEKSEGSQRTSTASAQTSGSGPGSLARMIGRWFLPRSADRRTPRRRIGTTARILACDLTDAVADDLRRRLEEELPGTSLITAENVEGATEAFQSLQAVASAAHGRRAMQRWLSNIAPDLILWNGSVMANVILETAIEEGIPYIAVGVPAVTSSSMPSAARRSLRSVLSHAHVVLSQDEDAARTLRSAAPAGSRIEPLGRIRPILRPPPCSTAERDELAQTLNARPVWLAAFPSEPELDAVLAAHRQALHGAHRLLLIIAVQSEDMGSALTTHLRSEGWRVERRGMEAEPDDSIEIFVADTPEEMGLWYRLCPITFLGGTLGGGPFADLAGPASLGSAIIVGPCNPTIDTPDTAEFFDLLMRLARAGGLTRIEQGAELSDAVGDLLAPDRAAARAHAAWDVISDSARVQERVVDEIRAAFRARSG